jgi:hypothetical protein
MMDFLTMRVMMEEVAVEIGVLTNQSSLRYQIDIDEEGVVEAMDHFMTTMMGWDQSFQLLLVEPLTRLTHLDNAFLARRQACIVAYH